MNTVELYVDGKCFRCELTNEQLENLQAGDTTAEAQSKDTTLWSEGETRKLLEKFTNCMPEVGPMKKFKDKKTMWTAIAAELRHETGIERTPLQCENRLKTVKKRYSNARKHNRQSGVSPVEVPYAEEMSKLATVDDSVFPEVMRSVGRVERNPPHMSQVSASAGQANVQASAVDHGSGAAQESDVAASPSASKRPRTSQSLANVLWMIHKDREEARERRHQEKMALIGQLFSEKN
ncbi:hypothetical protein HPB52_006441 [Rhipicephalus sanguineus]|uniref:Myb/SANT-like DNA-binding domain-containing protein n=1 Tax=Rhipicephalus sanguineus TaxID=34632 RepID=A0A9D4SS27_RHISA|nr:hypothetical protein HPB52_006441 [Rhipicephalus sanguineus]